MSSKAMLETYLHQGKEYKKLLEKVNHNGRYNGKIKKINEKLKIAAQNLKKM